MCICILWRKSRILRHGKREPAVAVKRLETATVLHKPSGVELFPCNLIAYETVIRMLNEDGRAAMIHPTARASLLLHSNWQRNTQKHVSADFHPVSAFSGRKRTVMNGQTAWLCLRIYSLHGLYRH